MNHVLEYKDDRMNVVLEFHKNKLPKEKIKEIIETYRAYGFHGNFIHKPVN